MRAGWNSYYLLASQLTGQWFAVVSVLNLCCPAALLRISLKHLTVSKTPFKKEAVNVIFFCQCSTNQVNLLTT